MCSEQSDEGGDVVVTWMMMRVGSNGVDCFKFYTVQLRNHSARNVQRTIHVQQLRYLDGNAEQLHFAPQSWCQDLRMGRCSSQVSRFVVKKQPGSTKVFCKVKASCQACVPMTGEQL